MKKGVKAEIKHGINLALFPKLDSKKLDREIAKLIISNLIKTYTQPIVYTSFLKLKKNLSNINRIDNSIPKEIELTLKSLINKVGYKSISLIIFHKSRSEIKESKKVINKEVNDKINDNKINIRKRPRGRPKMHDNLEKKQIINLWYREKPNSPFFYMGVSEIRNNLIAKMKCKDKSCIAFADYNLIDKELIIYSLHSKKFEDHSYLVSEKKLKKMNYFKYMENNLNILAIEIFNPKYKNIKNIVNNFKISFTKDLINNNLNNNINNNNIINNKINNNINQNNIDIILKENEEIKNIEKKDININEENKNINIIDQNKKEEENNKKNGQNNKKNNYNGKINKTEENKNNSLHNLNNLTTMDVLMKDINLQTEDNKIGTESIDNNSNNLGKMRDLNFQTEDNKIGSETLDNNNNILSNNHEKSYENIINHKIQIKKEKNEITNINNNEIKENIQKENKKSIIQKSINEKSINQKSIIEKSINQKNNLETLVNKNNNNVNIKEKKEIINIEDYIFKLDEEQINNVKNIINENCIDKENKVKSTIINKYNNDFEISYYDDESDSNENTIKKNDKIIISSTNKSINSESTIKIYNYKSQSKNIGIKKEKIDEEWEYKEEVIEISDDEENKDKKKDNNNSYLSYIEEIIELEKTNLGRKRGRKTKIIEINDDDNNESEKKEDEIKLIDKINDKNNKNYFIYGEKYFINKINSVNNYNEKIIDLTYNKRREESYSVYNNSNLYSTKEETIEKKRKNKNMVKTREIFGKIGHFKKDKVAFIKEEKNNKLSIKKEKINNI